MAPIRRSAAAAVDALGSPIAAAGAGSGLTEGRTASRRAAQTNPRPVVDEPRGALYEFATDLPGARRMSVVVTGPDGEPIEATWISLPASAETPGGTAVVELASTSGIGLLGDRRVPWDAGTVGFGEAIAAALDHGVGRLVLSLDQAASIDGGAGMLTALGAVLTDSSCRIILPGARGLEHVAHAELEGLRALPHRGVLALTDSMNPLLGPAGACAVVGPQAGLDARDVPAVEDGLRRLAGRLPVDYRTPGAGSAGGTGLALLAWGARLVPCAVGIAELMDLREEIEQAH
ncbi:glycerate kinase [Microbacterium sp. B2969]|uniref:Glycerate kinase n=1 Tax=Microbacterium alkaliflavum TaxID=3248839 RepID=A0ABW7Q9A4_9MICO